MTRLVFLVLILLFPIQANAYSLVDDWYIKQNKDNQITLKIKVSQKAQYKLIQLTKPSRTAIDLLDTRLNTKKTYQGNIEQITKIRIGIQNGYNLRFVLDHPNIELKIEKHFLDSGFLYIILKGSKNLKAITNIKPKIQTQAEEVVKSVSTHDKKSAFKTIIIDPGHGGKDEGTRGTYTHIKEKHLTLQIAKLLKYKLTQNKKYKVYLTRNDDSFVPLRVRANFANKYNADLFISIHADSNPEPSLKGLSVYTINEKASDKDAEKLALDAQKYEDMNHKTYIKGNHEVNEALNEIAQRERLNASTRFASLLIDELSENTTTLNKAHRFANFKVLKNPNTPAILIELGYLSNIQEEKLLQSLNYQNKLTDSIVKSIHKKFE